MYIPLLVYAILISVYKRNELPVDKLYVENIHRWKSHPICSAMIFSALNNHDYFPRGDIAI